MKIAKSSAFSPYPNTSESTRICLENSSNDELRSLVRSHCFLYEKEQAKFLSKFYTTIKLSTLKKNVGNEFINYLIYMNF